MPGVLESREDLQHAVTRLCASLEPHLSAGRARVRLPGPRAHYAAAAQEMEGWCRRLWGLAPLLAGGGRYPNDVAVHQGLTLGCDPCHPEYWGHPGDYDQRFVEAAAIAVALLLAPDAFWKPLASRDRANVAAYLGIVNDYRLHDTNWLFFRILANAALARLDAPHNRRQMNEDLRRIESFYVGGGWYSDGLEAPCDYYCSWAIHFYSLLYAVYMRDEDSERVARFRERAAMFAGNFIKWFASDGAALPFGRSLTYRCCQVSFWGALAFANVDALPGGALKGIVLRNLRWWFERPITSTDGLLTLGYGYSNSSIVERYSSPCSPYWALKAFLPIALAPTSAFWAAPEEPLPDLRPVSVQAEPGMVVCRHGGHVFALAAGAKVPGRHRGSAEKYAKFCYSTRYGFSVSSGPRHLHCGAHDSMLSVSTDGDYYRVRQSSERVEILGETIVSDWSPSEGVDIRTWLIPMLPWHVRVHHIRTDRPMTTAEGGFALALGDDDETWTDCSERGDETVAAAQTVHGMSVVRNLHDRRDADIVRADPNTNILFPRSVIPTLIGRHAAGEWWLASAVAAWDPASSREHVEVPVPRFRTANGTFAVSSEESDAGVRFSLGARAHELGAD